MTRPMMFLSFNRGNKENGYYTLRPGQAIQKLVEGPYIYAIAGFARKGDRLIYTRENFNEFRDLWTSNERFGDSLKLTNANPQQADYKWGSVELFKWTDFNGNECEGLLRFPEDYDPVETLPDHRLFLRSANFPEIPLQYSVTEPFDHQSGLLHQQRLHRLYPGYQISRRISGQRLLRCGSERNDGADRPRNRR